MFRNIYIKFWLLFVVVEVIAIVILYGVNHFVLSSSMEKVEANYSKTYKTLQTTFLKNSIDEAKKNLETLINTNNFSNFVNNNNTLEIQQLLYDMVSTRNDILQLRIIDTNGYEYFRVQKYDNDITALFVEKSQLQNKSHRKYFQDGMKLSKNQFLISDFNLNQEYKKIEIPHTPTLRVITPLIEDGKKLGLFVINLNMSKFVSIFNSIENVDVYLVDKDGNYLIHPDNKKSWSKDLKNNFTLTDDLDKNIVNNILNNNTYQNNFLFSYSLEDIFMNNQGIKIVYQVKESFIDTSIYQSIHQIIMILLPFNLLLGLFIISYYSKIKYKLSHEIVKNDENIKLLNEYVPTSIADENGLIKEVNEAFCNLTGYSKNELVGRSHSILKSGYQSKEFYENMWKTISSGNVWNGEFENLKKNKQKYWIEMVIYPKVNPETNEKEYFSISHNVTDKKLMDKLAHTDHLTNLANRKKIDHELEHAIYQVKRNDVDYVILLLDIDYFKKVNDTYGHQVGDSVLVEVSNILRANTRKSDFIGRWGGEEFVIIASHTSCENGLKLAQKIRESVEKYKFKTVGHKSISIGLSCFSKDDDSQTVMERVDSLLYKAKETGRNKVVYDESI